MANRKAPSPNGPKGTRLPLAAMLSNLELFAGEWPDCPPAGAEPEVLERYFAAIAQELARVRRMISEGRLLGSPAMQQAFRESWLPLMDGEA